MNLNEYWEFWVLQYLLTLSISMLFKDVCRNSEAFFFFFCRFLHMFDLILWQSRGLSHPLSWRHGKIVITTAQLYSTKHWLRFCICSNLAHGILVYFRWWKPLTMAPFGTKAKRLLSVNQSAKASSWWSSTSS